ncbi:family 1 glycosylhydrolase [Nocardia alni]|uniref:family 1 glycosylhydrolase n=1 Tax=Nocardia alni TaxID=2815723 RepID=UPI001C232C7F|nr:family 1 glycosylhydrolase [Nocardia alni]
MGTPNRRQVLAGCAAAAAALVTRGTAGGTPPSGLGGPLRESAGAVAQLGGNFFWGVSTSGFQTEGYAPDSNWSRFVSSGRAEPYYNSVRFWDRYAEDIGNARAMGAGVYRMSIEWARVQPRPLIWDEQALNHYGQIVETIVRHGMTPMLTLDHWVYPGWVADMGGWNTDAMIGLWLANAAAVVQRFDRYRPIWVTINEPIAYIGSEQRIGRISQAQREPMLNRLAAVHNAAFASIHALRPNALVTSNLGYVPGVGLDVNHRFLDLIGENFDFLGIDYYWASGGSGNLWDLPVHTEGIYYALRHYARQFPNKPLYIVENGMTTENGRPRADGYTRAGHLRDTVYWVQRAKADGVNVIGYNYWSLNDNYEWGSYTPRFGLYTVDVVGDARLARIPTDGVGAFRDVIAAGGVPGNYRPTHPPAPCAQVDSANNCGLPVGVP